jgi:hypothetical protein
VEAEGNQEEELILKGSLEAIKLTGDPNVPRGEISWISDDIGPDGLVRIAVERPFRGARMVRSRGHVAHLGFIDGMYSALSYVSSRNTPRTIHVSWRLYYEQRTNCNVADKFLTSQLILISRDCVAHYWEDLDHISYFYRIDIDSLLRT